MDSSPPGSSVTGISQGRILQWVAISSPEDLPNPGIEPAYLVSSALAGGCFPIEPQQGSLTLTIRLSYFLGVKKNGMYKYFILVPSTLHHPHLAIP